MADSKDNDRKKGLIGCLAIIAGIFFVLVLVGVIGQALESPEDKAEREARQAQAAAERQAEREAEEALERALSCVQAADEPENVDSPWACDFCFQPAVDNAIRRRLVSSSSYDSGRLVWGEGTKPQVFYFVQRFTAQNAFGATLDMHAIGTFAESCAVTSIEVIEGQVTQTSIATAMLLTLEAPQEEAEKNAQQAPAATMDAAKRVAFAAAFNENAAPAVMATVSGGDLVITLKEVSLGASANEVCPLIDTLFDHETLRSMREIEFTHISFTDPIVRCPIN